MKIIYNKVIPFSSFVAINLFGILFVRKEYKGRVKDTLINHEQIHTAQMKELLYVFFYIIYFFEWIYQLIAPPFKTAYKDISFEREAKENAKNLNYLKERKHFAQWRRNK